MALLRPPVGHAATALQDSLRILLIVGTVLLIMVVATAAFGWQGFGPPSFDLTPDPAGSLPF
ncbi:MAG TPA: hypothetical protein VJ141_01595 [Candidatus Limnocylindrales bacterium]|nr:hypothetical protein [Candidatus Limnocylindrales bacterium]